MQKFGLQRRDSSQLNAIELEIVKEQATALGRAGKKLRISLENYETLTHKQPDLEYDQSLIKEISDNVWQLMLQREFLGFTENNLRWVRANYLIPDAAIRILGTSDK